jgi:secreted trypsin-like serine protease
MTSGTATVTAGLAGTGTVAPILVLPPPIDLGAVIVGTTVTRTVTLTNSGGGPLNFSSITVTAPFTLTNNCPATLQPGQSCDIVIGIDSSTVGSFAGTLTIVSDGGSGTIALTANVQKVPIPVLKISPTTVGFGDRIVGSASASQRITILNDGGADAAITGVTPSPDFVVTANSCGTNLAPSATCFVDVAMRAIGFGRRVGQLVIGSNATGAPHTVSLSGTGCRPFSATGVRTGPRSNCRP